MVEFYYDEYGIDNGSESVSEITRQQVFERDGTRCWLCEYSNQEVLNIAHQIEAVDEAELAIFKAEGTLPDTITDPSHKDNLFPLCINCHVKYDTGFPSWILIPDESTLQKYIDHEKENYEHRRYLISQAATTISTPKSLSRTLPIIDRSKVRYYPAIISPALSLRKFDFSRWPKVWLGEPTTVIHRVARRGLLQSTPLRPISSSLGPGKGWWQRGVPAIFPVLIGELFRLWARPTPTPNLTAPKGQ
jgi:hypothetical protein